MGSVARGDVLQVGGVCVEIAEDLAVGEADGVVGRVVVRVAEEAAVRIDSRVRVQHNLAAAVQPNVRVRSRRLVVALRAFQKPSKRREEEEGGDGAAT